MRSAVVAGPGLAASADPEDRESGCDGQQLLVGGVGRNVLEEHADLPLPALEVRAQHRVLVLVGEFGGGEPLGPAAHPELTTPGDAQVTHPLRLAARGDQEPVTVQGQQIHRRAPPLAAGAPSHVQDAGSHDADPGAGHGLDSSVKDVHGEATWLHVAGRWVGAHYLHSLARALLLSKSNVARKGRRSQEQCSRFRLAHATGEEATDEQAATWRAAVTRGVAGRPGHAGWPGRTRHCRSRPAGWGTRRRRSPAALWSP